VHVRALPTNAERAIEKMDAAAGERERLVAALDSVDGNKQAAARALGISTRAFYRRLERHGLHSASRMA
jgi:transcriptional regulator of acetoin/glycerol metabolism